MPRPCYGVRESTPGQSRLFLLTLHPDWGHFPENRAIPREPWLLWGHDVLSLRPANMLQSRDGSKTIAAVQKETE